MTKHEILEACNIRPAMQQPTTPEVPYKNKQA